MQSGNQKQGNKTLHTPETSKHRETRLSLNQANKPRPGLVRLLRPPARKRSQPHACNHAPSPHRTHFSWVDHDWTMTIQSLLQAPRRRPEPNMRFERIKKIRIHNEVVGCVGVRVLYQWFWPAKLLDLIKLWWPTLLESRLLAASKLTL